MARLRTRVERAAVLHRQAAAAVAATAAAVDGYSPSSAPAEQYAEQHDLAARLRAAAADLIPGWLGSGLDAVSAATPAGDTAVPAYLRLGLAHPLDDARFPAIAPLLGSGHLAIDADARDPRVAGLLRSVLLRLVAAAAPGSLTIRVIDAAGDGDTTTAFAELPSLAPPATDHSGMQTVLIEADRWIRGREANDPAADSRAGQYFVLVIAALPELTDGNDLARIAQLAREGVGNRLHLVVAGWPPPPLTAETTQPPLPRSTQVSLRNPYAWIGDPPGATYSASGVGPSRLNAPVYLDSDPPADVIRRVCAELAAAGGTREPGAGASLWAPSPQRWKDYMTAAQRLDAVRREAAKVVTDQSAAVKRVRAEVSTARRQVAMQHKRIVDLVRDGQPLPLHPNPNELGAAEAALGRLAQAASARAVAAKRAAAAGKTGNPPTGGLNPGTATGGFPIVTPGTAANPPTGGLPRAPETRPPGAPGPPGPAWPPRPPAPHSGTRQAGPPAHPGQPGRSMDGTGAFGPPTTPAPGGYGPGGGQARPRTHHTGPMPAQVQVTSPPRPTGPLPYAPVSGPGGRRPTSGPSAPPVSGPGGPHTGPGGPHTSGYGAPPVSGPGGRPPVPHSAPPGPHSAPPGPPVSGVPHPAYANTGSFPVVSAPPNTGITGPVSGPPAAPATPGPPATYPRLPEAAMTMIGEARAALQRADAELTDVDARISRSPGLRNATIYGAYAVLFALVQLPMMASLFVRTASPVAGVPCGLILVGLSFWLAWLTIGFAYREPSGQRPHRTPALGIVISLLAAAPAFVTTMWAAVTVLGD